MKHAIVSHGRPSLYCNNVTDQTKVFIPTKAYMSFTVDQEQSVFCWHRDIAQVSAARRFSAFATRAPPPPVILNNAIIIKVDHFSFTALVSEVTFLRQDTTNKHHKVPEQHSVPVNTLVNVCQELLLGNNTGSYDPNNPWWSNQPPSSCHVGLEKEDVICLDDGSCTIPMLRDFSAITVRHANTRLLHLCLINLIDLVASNVTTLKIDNHTAMCVVDIHALVIYDYE